MKRRRNRKVASLRRRDILVGVGPLAVGAAFPAPAVAQSIRRLKMVTDWPEALPGLQASAVRFAQTIGTASGGRIKIDVFPAGALVRPFETFDAVGRVSLTCTRPTKVILRRSRQRCISSPHCPLA